LSSSLNLPERAGSLNLEMRSLLLSFAINSFN
jgi:hypothetical protein